MSPCLSSCYYVNLTTELSSSGLGSAITCKESKRLGKLVIDSTPNDIHCNLIPIVLSPLRRHLSAKSKHTGQFFLNVDSIKTCEQAHSV